MVPYFRSIPIRPSLWSHVNSGKCGWPPGVWSGRGERGGAAAPAPAG
uniref:Uncharacterized protein n=1 Tax=Arundo donax TaxID=35708 RepID=A0A0A8YXG8_ARUDO